MVKCTMSTVHRTERIILSRAGASSHVSRKT